MSLTFGPFCDEAANIENKIKIKRHILHTESPVFTGIKPDQAAFIAQSW